jgi:B9 domain-containing protein 2
LSGYGFAHLPLISGYHKIDICLWRPIGNTEQELSSFLLGHSVSLLSHETLYESAWKDRCRLVTVSAGHVFINLNVVMRFFKNFGVDVVKQ